MLFKSQFYISLNSNSHSDNINIEKSILVQMKVCHVCEKVVKVLRSLTCLDCKRTYCFPCIAKYFPSHSKQLLPETESEALKMSKIKQCFYCLKQCICEKCRNIHSILILPNTNVQEQSQEDKVASLIKEEQPITQNGFFKGKKFSEMPGFMQRAYLKKKVIYTKHELSIPSMMSIANAEEMNAQRPDQTAKKDEKKGNQSGGQQIDQSIIANLHGECSVSDKNRMDVENQSQSEQNERGDNDEDQNQQSGDENAASSQQNANQMVEENENSSSKKEIVGQDQPQEDQSSSKKPEDISQQRKKIKKRLKQALENVQSQSSIELIQQE